MVKQRRENGHRGRSGWQRDAAASYPVHCTSTAPGAATPITQRRGRRCVTARRRLGWALGSGLPSARGILSYALVSGVGAGVGEAGSAMPRVPAPCRELAQRHNTDVRTTGVTALVRRRIMPFVAVLICVLAHLPALAPAGRAVAHAQQPASRPRVGLALGGGGARGLAHIGVLEWLEEHRIPVDAIAGTSMGGLVGGGYATGRSAAEVRAMVAGIDWDRVFRGEVEYALKSFRRKEDRRSHPVRLEFGLRGGLRLEPTKDGRRGRRDGPPDQDCPRYGRQGPHCRDDHPQDAPRQCAEPGPRST